MYPACLRGPVTADLDGIRLSEGRRRDAQSSYRAVCSDNTSGLISPGYLFRHHVLFTLALPLALPSHGVEVLLLVYHGPDCPGRFIGHGHQDDIGRPLYQ